MSGTKNPGDAITAIKTIVSADYSAALTAVSALYSDGVTLQDFDRIYRAPLPRYQAFPVLVVYPSGSGYDYDNTDFDGGLPGLRYHDVTFQIIVQGNQQTTAYHPREYLELQLERQFLALENTLTAKPRLTISSTDYASRLFIDDVQYVDVATDDGSPFMMSGFLNTRIIASL